MREVSGGWGKGVSSILDTIPRRIKDPPVYPVDKKACNFDFLFSFFKGTSCVSAHVCVQHEHTPHQIRYVLYGGANSTLTASRACFSWNVLST